MLPKLGLAAMRATSTGFAAMFERLPLAPISMIFGMIGRSSTSSRTQTIEQTMCDKSAMHIVATFGPEGPTKCSGLDVVRYDADTLHDEFGSTFRLVKHRTELHQTPMGS